METAMEGMEREAAEPASNKSSDKTPDNALNKISDKAPDKKKDRAPDQAPERPAGTRRKQYRRLEQQGRTYRRTGPGKKKSGKRGRRGNPSKQPVAESFRHAFDGLFVGLTERNMKIHCTMAVLVVVFGVLLRISVTEWCLCFVLFGLIMGLELVNTSIEAVVDLVTKEYRPLAKRAKDTAAGAVLIAAIFAAVTGLIIFVPRLLYVLRGLF